MKISEIYTKLKTKNISLLQFSKDSGVPYATLHYHLKKYCKKNVLEMPLGKAGRPAIEEEKEFNLKK